PRSWVRPGPLGRAPAAPLNEGRARQAGAVLSSGRAVLLVFESERAGGPSAPPQLPTPPAEVWTATVADPRPRLRPRQPTPAPFVRGPRLRLPLLTRPSPLRADD